MTQPGSLLRRSALAASAALLAAPATASETAAAREYQAVKTRDGAPIHLAMYRKPSAVGGFPCCSSCMALQQARFPASTCASPAPKIIQ